MRPPAARRALAAALAAVAAVAFLASSASAAVEFKHHNNTELAEVLQRVHNRCPDITRLYTLSETSVNGVPLYVLEITDKPGKHELSKFQFVVWGRLWLRSWRVRTAESVFWNEEGQYCDG